MKTLIFAVFFVALSRLGVAQNSELPPELQLDHAFGASFSPQSIAFSPDATKLAIAGSDGVKIYESATGKVLETRVANRWRTSSVAWSRDGKSLAAGGLSLQSSGAGEIFLWRGGAKPLRWATGRADIAALAFSPDGTVLASAGGGDLIGEGAPASLRLWDARTGKLRRTLHNYWADGALVAFDNAKTLHFERSNGRGDEYETFIFDLTSGRKIKTEAALFLDSPHRFGGLSWKLEPTNGDFKKMRLIARKAGATRPVATQDLGLNSVSRVVWGGSYFARISLDGNILVGAGGVQIWKIDFNPQRARPLYRLNRSAQAAKIALSGDSQILAIATAKGTALLDQNLKLSRFLPRGDGAERDLFNSNLSMARDGKRLFDGRWLDWSESPARPIAPVREFGNSAFAVSPDGKTLVGSFGGGNRVGIKTENGREIELIFPRPSDEEPDRFYQINGLKRAAWSPDGTRFAVIGDANTNDQLFVFDQNGVFQREIQAENFAMLHFSAVAFSPDSQTILTGARSDSGSTTGARLDFWNASTGALQKTVMLPQSQNSIFGSGQISEVAFASDGQIYAASGIVSRGGAFEPRLLCFGRQSDAVVGDLPLSSFPLWTSSWVFLDNRRVALLRGHALEIWDFDAHQREKSLFLVPHQAGLKLETRF